MIDSHLVDHEYKVILDGDLPLNLLEKTLENRYGELWKKYKREIKINTILEDKSKKILFTISGGFFYGYLGKQENGANSIYKSSFSIKEMNFIIQDEKVIDFRIKIRPLTSENGNILMGLIESNMVMKMKIGFYGDYFHFYLDC